MTLEKRDHPALEDFRIHVKVKLAALWVAVMFCYVYGDFVGLFKPGKLQMMIAGRMPLREVSQRVLLGMAAVMAIPSAMIFFSLVLPPRSSRGANIVFGILYSTIMIITMRGAWHFYIFLGCIEIGLTTLVVWYAWTWPLNAQRKLDVCNHLRCIKGQLLWHKQRFGRVLETGRGATHTPCGQMGLRRFPQIILSLVLPAEQNALSRFSKLQVRAVRNEIGTRRRGVCSYPLWTVTVAKFTSCFPTEHFKTATQSTHTGRMIRSS